MVLTSRDGLTSRSSQGDINDRKRLKTGIHKGMAPKGSAALYSGPECGEPFSEIVSTGTRAFSPGRNFENRRGPSRDGVGLNTVERLIHRVWISRCLSVRDYALTTDLAVDFAKRLPNICNKIMDILNPDRKPHDIRPCTRSNLLFWCQLCMCCGSRVNNQ